jgi:hypothetical protein
MRVGEDGQLSGFRDPRSSEIGLKNANGAALEKWQDLEARAVALAEGDPYWTSASEPRVTPDVLGSERRFQPEDIIICGQRVREAYGASFVQSPERIDGQADFLAECGSHGSDRIEAVGFGIAQEQLERARTKRVESHGLGDAGVNRRAMKA